MSGIVWKHEAPRRCRILRALFGASPSAISGCCTFGLRNGCRACKGCEHNVTELMLEGFEEGAKRARERDTELRDAGLECLTEDIPSQCATAKARGEKETKYVTGCEWRLPLRAECRECCHWSESRHGAAVGALIAEGLAEGLADATPDSEETEPPEPEKQPDYVEAFKRLAEASAVLAQAISDWVANLVQAIEPAVEYYADIVAEVWQKVIENAAKKPPRVNKRPDYSQKAKDDTRGKIKRIRTQRSREKK